MLRLIEAKNFRCLRYIKQYLGNFHVLIGPNASGKTTFLDVIAFLGRLVSDGLELAISERTDNFNDLVWNRGDTNFELAVEAAIPKHIGKLLDNEFDKVRYEVVIGHDDYVGESGIYEEKVMLISAEDVEDVTTQRLLFPDEPIVPDTIMTKPRKGVRTILTKARGGNDNFYVEVRKEGAGKGWFPSIKLGPKKSALGNLPEDEHKFPVSTWLKSLLTSGVQSISLNSMALRKASPPSKSKSYLPDGSNLPWVIHNLSKDKLRFKNWIHHLQTALPDLVSIKTIQRNDDKHRYLLLSYKGGVDVPSWMASDGTLRLLALTAAAYLASFQGVYLIEEPENGIHPRAVETLFQSMSSIYDAQLLMATHSPVILSMAKIDDILCFKKTENGATDIVIGRDHPSLRNWKGETNIGVMFAGGVLG